ncbi:TetR family transcriptional regulator [Micrococcales bacterium 31B]|nr:TetR family transcriptional regulator [Micrococcales bacterium 31B]
MHVIAQKGLRGMTYRSVAEAAGVDNSLVAHHFGNRDTLVSETLKWVTEQSISESRIDDFATSPDSFQSALGDSLHRDADLHLFQFEMIIEARRRPDLAPLVRNLYEGHIGALARSVETHTGSPIGDVSARALFAAMDGLALQFLGGVIDREGLDAGLRRVWEGSGLAA